MSDLHQELEAAAHSLASYCRMQALYAAVQSHQGCNKEVIVDVAKTYEGYLLGPAEVEVPEHCPGHKDPRCRGACTLIAHEVDGKLVIGEGSKIKDPDCFR